jgi:tetratricopeptide (TPR) repeat protein
MKPAHRTSVTAALLLVASLTGAVTMQRRVEALRPAATLEEVLYVSSPRLLKYMSLGYEGLLANIYWTRAVQYFGSKHMHQVETTHYNLLAPLLDITTSLDPHLTVAYEFGANFLSPKPPNGAGQPDKAVALVEKGIAANPDQWRLYYALGFVQYMDKHDFRAAAEAFDRGSRVPDAHPWLRILAAQMAQRGGDVQTARMLWSATYETSKDKMIRENAVSHLRALQVDEDITLLEKVVSEYQKRTGRQPGGFRELISAGWLRDTPLDPMGNPYVLSADGRVLVRHPDQFPFIQKGLP